MLALVALLTAVVGTGTALAIADRRDPEITEPAAEEIPLALDRIQPGAATERDVRAEFGRPTEVLPGIGNTDRCLRYTNLPYNQRAYRFCFERGVLRLLSAQ